MNQRNQKKDAQRRVQFMLNALGVTFGETTAVTPIQALELAEKAGWRPTEYQRRVFCGKWHAYTGNKSAWGQTTTLAIKEKHQA